MVAVGPWLLTHALTVNDLYHEALPRVREFAGPCTLARLLALAAGGRNGA